MNNPLSYKRILLLLLLLLSAPALAAQEDMDPDTGLPDARYPYRREILAGNFGKASQKIARKLEKDSGDMAYNYAAYRLYSAPAFPERDLARAYNHLAVALQAYIHSAPRQIERLTRDGFDGTLFSADLRRIGTLALAQAHATGTIDAYNSLLAHFTQNPDDLLARATYSRDSIELAGAAIAGRPEDFQAFILRRPNSALARQAIAMRDSSAFQLAQRVHTPQAYEAFLREYPLSELYSRATDSLHAIAFRQAEQADAEHFYRSFANRYPHSPQASVAEHRADSILYYTTTDTADWRSFILYLDSPTPHPAEWQLRALHSLARIVLSGIDIDPVAQTLAHTPATDTFYLPLASRLRSAYLLPSVQNHQRLYSAYGHLLPIEWRVKDSLALNAYNAYNYHIIDSCIRAIAPYHEAYILLQQLIDHDIRYSRADQALQRIEPYREVFEESEEYTRLYATLSNGNNDGNSPRSEIQFSLPIPLKGTDCSNPLPSLDGNTMYLSVKGHSENIGGADIFSARRRGNDWSKPRIEMDLSHTYGNEIPIAMTADGTLMLTQQGGRFYLSQRKKGTKGGWLPAEPLLAKYDRPVADAFLTADGRAILLSMPGKEGYQPDSSLNLYVMLRDTNGTLSAPIDLGPAINTPLAERAPCLLPDMRTLYFASEGHGSLGQFDIFVVTRLSDDSWDRWSEPRNLGVGINTVDNDTWIRLAPDGKTAYTHRRNGRMEIVSFQLP